MQRHFLWLAALTLASLLSLSTAPCSAEDSETVVYDEAKQGDFGPTKPDAKVAVSVTKPGVHVIKGSGIDAVDDADTFVFEVTGEKSFDFCLIADPAEFKKLYSIDADGKATEIAFGSTNPRFRVPRNIEKSDLPPGKYQVEMMFGPQAALGDWVVKIAQSDGTKRETPLCVPAEEVTTAEKMKNVDWPGAISIYHGHNWGDDKKYLIAIKEAGYGASGAAEWQIKECAEHGLRTFVFIWPHESATIPKKYKDEKNVLCYYLSDRIEPHKWGSWASLEKMCYSGDPHHPAFFTMRGLWGGIDGFCPTVRGRAMEYYHYHWDGNRKPHMHFALMEQYRQASVKNGHVPVCRIVEVRPEDMRKTRQTVYTGLAYGQRGFRMGGSIFDPSKRDERGVPSRNAYGEEIKNINAAVNAYSPIFKKAHCQAVYHVAPLPPGCAAPPDDSWVKLDGKEVLVGLFREDGDDKKEEDYLLVANRDAFNKQTATVKIAGKDATIQRMDKTTSKWVDAPGKNVGEETHVTLELEDGSGELLKVERKK